MDPLYINIGDTIANSSVGGGTVTGFYKDFPQVNGKAVGRLVRTDGAVFGPMGQLRLPEDVATPPIPAQVTTLGSPEMAPAPKQTFVPPAPQVVEPPAAPVTAAEIAADITKELETKEHVSIEVPAGSVEAMDDSPHN